MAQLICCAYRLRAFVILALAEACLRFTACLCCCCCCCLSKRFSSNAWRFALLFGGRCPRHVPMTPGGALFFFMSPTPGLLNSLLPGLVDSLDWTPGLSFDWTPGLLQSLLPGLFNSLAWTPGLPLDWTPGLLKSLPPGLTGAPGRGALDDDCCASWRVRSFVGVFRDTSSSLSELLDAGCW